MKSLSYAIECRSPAGAASDQFASFAMKANDVPSMEHQSQSTSAEADDELSKVGASARHESQFYKRSSKQRQLALSQQRGLAITIATGLYRGP